MSFCARDFLRRFFPCALKAELKMIEASFDERSESGLIERQARRDEVQVESGGASSSNEVKNVRARERFAAGEVGLQNAEGSCLAKNA